MFFTREEAARQQLRISLTSLDRLIRGGRIRAAKIGRRVVISPQALDQFRRAVEAEEWGEAGGGDAA